MNKNTNKQTNKQANKQTNSDSNSNIDMTKQFLTYTRNTNS